MPSESIDYDAVIADLIVKRNGFNEAIDNAINSIRYVTAAVAGLDMGSHIMSAPSVPTSTASSALTPDAFFGLSIAEAAIKYLAIVKRQQSSREITDALEKAGYHHTSQNFLNTVNTALYRREKDEGDVVKIGRQWAMTEWYPGRRKAKRGEPGEPILAVEDDAK